jgi:hypothetical protein
MVVEQDTMLRLTLIVITFTALIAGVAANAQSDRGYVAPERSNPTPGHLLDQDYLMSTGETVPRPGVSQSSGTTPLDRAIREQMTVSTAAFARVADTTDYRRPTRRDYPTLAHDPMYN